ncbi:MAG: hypothetical protein QOG59_2393 [Solirubrobacteraceae bacterium]|nr:hypothetical protein [Solirubrobacteraceae bacterium]
MTGFYIKALVLAVLVGAVTGLATVQAKQIQAGWVALAVVGVFALALLRGLARRAATTYTVTSRRLVIERGLVRRDYQEAPLQRIQNVFAHQTIRQRLLRVGTVHFDTAAGAEFDFCFRGVERPRELMAAVDRALSERHRADWSEYDYAPPPRARI